MSQRISRSQRGRQNVIVVTDPSATHTRRNLIGFWLLGLCNNFAYVIMLSAAHDILKEQEKTVEPDHNGTTTTSSPYSGKDYLQCNEISTGAILLADILPTLLIKLTAPFYIQRINYRLKVLCCVFFSLSSFLVVSFSTGIWMSILGVICASISGGLGETTYFGFSSYFHKNMISAYSSGTGGAGLFGSLAYAGLTSAGLSPRNTLLVMVVIPVTMFVSFFFIIVKPTSFYQLKYKAESGSEDSTTLLYESAEIKKLHVPWKRKLMLIKPLLKYMIPLVLVYIAEYFINQGLYELLYFNDIWLDEKEQYRWYQVDYQLGVFISRSSVNLIKINQLWILSVLQFVNVGVLTLQVFYRVIPNIWIIFAFVLFEGLLGGSAFVNTFYKISEDTAPEHKEFSLTVATIADSFGISIAGVISIPSHNHICSLHLKM